MIIDVEDFSCPVSWNCSACLSPDDAVVALGIIGYSFHESLVFLVARVAVKHEHFPYALSAVVHYALLPVALYHIERVVKAVVLCIICSHEECVAMGAHLLQIASAHSIFVESIVKFYAVILTIVR